MFNKPNYPTNAYSSGNNKSTSPANIKSLIDMFMSQTGKTEKDLTETEKGYLEVLMSGDQNKGEQLAMNICASMGVTKEQALSKAMNFFNN